MGDRARAGPGGRVTAVGNAFAAGCKLLLDEFTIIVYNWVASRTAPISPPHCLIAFG